MWKEKIKKTLKNARCPVCGDKVFIPKEGFRKIYDENNDLNDPIVFCRDMAHWIGRLSECKIK